MIQIVLISIMVVACSWIGSMLLRKYAISRSIVDIPNERSSHSVPTPRGGGVAIALTFLVALSIYTGLVGAEQSYILALIVAGGLVAIVGFIDDHRHIAARWRLLVHFISAGLIVYSVGGLPPLSIYSELYENTWLRYLVALFYLVWLLNLYNFMDGIDGIASIEAITVSIGGIVLFFILDIDKVNLIVPVFLMSAVVGFVFWNFPRAKLFMGDVGSGFLGLVLGTASLQAAWSMSELFWSWLILLGVFIIDATITLLRRLLHGQKIYEAHKTHAYQNAARRLNSHARVSIGIGIINIVWLLPIAILVAKGYIHGVNGVIIAYIPLILLVFFYKAGRAESLSNH